MLKWYEFRPKLKQLGISPGKALVFMMGVGCSQQLMAQQAIPLTDLSGFKQPAANWRIAGDVNADLQKENALTATNGTGILVNLPEKGKHGQDLYTNWQHGDLDLELDYLVSSKSNSGIYLQGRYEIQLLDSWGAVTPRPSDNGGIYERWDDRRPEGQQGYDGHAPRQNASLAPGLWQHMKIAFQAPRFDAAGNKIANAVILKIELNGVTIQENVVLSGPTRGGMENNEVAEGPLRIQGDHGTVAFRNIKAQSYNAPKPELKAIQYAIYKGSFRQLPDFKTLKPVTTGEAAQLTSNLPGLPDNEFLVRYTAMLDVKAAGTYDFNLHTSGGGGQLKVNGQPLSGSRNRDARGGITLQPGSYPVEVLYAKNVDWAKPSLTLSVRSAAVREFVLSDLNVPADDPTDPILVAATENTVLRSFMDLRGGARVVHAVSVGSPVKVHYTYDMDHAAPVQAWRGEFLNTTPMWHDRGDGSSRPMGMVRILDNKPAMSLARLASAEAAWPSDTAGTAYRPKGYDLDPEGLPSFRFDIYGAAVTDTFRVLPGNTGLHRNLQVADTQDGLYARIAVADSISQLADGTYMIGDKAWYVKMDNNGAKPVIRRQQGKMELIVPVKTAIGYAIIF
ncbi:PA14 domain-containing protein [Chitinophaga eiseniae]|uniref:PA14 domain-containing protein n=1 Tax=Chitinophaga eiseniae TaxID=634771 RepID=A0A1T4NLT5_9BACT|nr:family 16 glycoside hydrolase [Chitinophaga eiseniae]SJZ79718.1 PA14 domain-containing protein [Chitinophaga eiseniae]